MVRIRISKNNLGRRYRANRSCDLSIIAAFLVLAAFLVKSNCAYAAQKDVIILRSEDEAVSTSGRQQLEGSVVRDDEMASAVTLSIDVPPSTSTATPKPEVKAASFALMDADTGQLVWSKNPHSRRPNASTTKVMTAILLIENCGMAEKIKASKKASETPYTSIHLMPGEELTAKDLLMAMMVRSANDAAVAIAEHIAGSTTRFAALMNKKAREIGCKNTHFVTPNGLYDKGHYSSACDLCLMFRYALRYPVFNEAINTRKYILASRTMNRKDLALFSRCRFLRDYPWAEGAKSGYVKQAGYCLVGTAVRNGWRLICAVLKSDNAGRDMAAIMDYGFANFEPYTVAKAGVPCGQVDVLGGSLAKVPVAPVRDVRVVVPRTGAKIIARIKPAKLEAPVRKGTRAGIIVLQVNGIPVGGVELRSACDVGLSLARRVWLCLKTSVLIIAVVIVGAYGAAFAKNTRGRRRRFSTSLRKTDRFW